MKHLEDMTEPELRRTLNVVGHAIKANLPRGALWVALVFDDPAIAQYVSNAQRPDIIKALREAADRLEKKEDVTR